MENLPAYLSRFFCTSLTLPEGRSHIPPTLSSIWKAHSTHFRSLILVQQLLALRADIPGSPPPPSSLPHAALSFRLPLSGISSPHSFSSRFSLSRGAITLYLVSHPLPRTITLLPQVRRALPRIITLGLRSSSASRALTLFLALSQKSRPLDAQQDPIFP